VRCDFAYPEPPSTPRSSATKTEASEPWPWAKLIVDFVAAGFTEELFWSLTPRQIEAHFAASRKRSRVERNMMVEALFTVKSAANSKTPTRLKDLMLDVDETPRRRKSVDELKAMLMLALGGPKTHG
jgi:hypothetical protein